MTQTFVRRRRIELRSLGFICNLVLVIWDLNTIIEEALNIKLIRPIRFDFPGHYAYDKRNFMEGG